ncbi:hypothetical protein DXG03_002775, partial [Asterophora parasitica]
DLKSDNILVEPSGICKISDFGISKQAEDILQVRAFTGMRGTIYWMAPEMLDSDKKKGYDVKVDIWSVGCVVLEMWTAKRPWYGEVEIWPVMIKLSQEKLPPPLPTDLVLSEKASDFRHQCFQIDPHDRPSAAQLQAHPYLELPANWKFDVSEIEASPALRRSASQTSRPYRGGRTLRSNHTLHSPPSNGGAVPLSTILRTATYRPLDKSPEPETPRSSPLRQRSNSRARTKPDNGPPLVYITPLHSHPPQNPLQVPNGNSGASLDTSGSYSIPRKGFRIINPDPEPDTQTDPFVYHPPPLPTLCVRAPYSTQLSPPAIHVANEAYSPFPSTTPTSSRHKTGAHQTRTSRRQTAVSESSGGYYYDSDNDDIWAVPPADMAGRGATPPRRERSFSRPRKASEARSRTTAHEEWLRPGPSEVYENLQGFFPEYDLDQPVAPVTPVDSSSIEREERKHRVKRSIRMVAEERNSRAKQGERRRTKFWDSKLEQLRM